ncbi:hypothetical protein Acr_10g0006580 [Actinidia rufa]|uniref:Uncharacterized protein n=1 Tax=Actinidia rufa TaxID=165716 RepID=A0A7J0F9I9_9ERIC|nr:hypothetical protein Acr_10g0006580 [Actinidia rufa]
MIEGANITDHLDEFNQLLTKLDAIDAEIKEEDKAILLLVSLPPSYEHQNHYHMNNRTTLMYEKYTLKLDEVVATLISHASMRKESENISDERIMVASNHGRDRGRTTKRKGGFKPKGSDKVKSNSEDATVIENCMDSEGEVVTVSLGTVNKVVTVGTVRFCMHDGRILKLTRVLAHARLEEKSNKMLDLQGCKFLSSDGGLEVVKRGDWALMRGTKVGKKEGQLLVLQEEVLCKETGLVDKAKRSLRKKVSFTPNLVSGGGRAQKRGEMEPCQIAKTLDRLEYTAFQNSFWVKNWLESADSLYVARWPHVFGFC